MTIAIFILFTLMVLGGGLMVVTSRNLIHSAAALILSLFGVAGLYVLLEAGFLAAIQILVYIGAIAVLIIFAVMMTRKVMEEEAETGLNSQWSGALLSAGLTLILLVIVINSVWEVGAGAVDVMAVGDPTTELGTALVDAGQYVLPFEVASILLLGAMVGAIVIARTRQNE